MLSLLLKPIPYIGITFCLLGLLGATFELMEERIDEPRDVSIAELEHTPLEELPGWITVTDGYPLWSEQVAVHSGPDGTGSLERLLVPYVSAEVAANWPALPSGPTTGFLLELTREELLQQFPEVATAIGSGSIADATSVGSGQQPCTMTFRPEDAEVKYALLAKSEKQAARELRDVGIGSIAVVRPGSHPNSTTETVSAIAVMLMVLFLCIVWIRKRRRQPRVVPSFSFNTSGLLRKGIESVRDSFLEACFTAGIDKLVSKIRREE